MLSLALGGAWVSAVLLAALDGRRRWVAGLGVALLALSLGVRVALLAEVASGGAMEMTTGGWPVEVGITLRVDLVGALFAALSTAVLLLALASEAVRGTRSRSFPALVAFLDVGLTGLFFTGDAFNFYVFFEVAMAASFALASYGGGPRRVRAALTFVIVNLVGSVLFLAAVASLYHVGGTLDLRALAERAATMSATGLLLTAALLFVALALKLGLFPFHLWVPQVYAGAHPAVAAILAGAVANIGAYGLIRFGAVLAGPLAVAATPLLVLGAVSVLYGGLVAATRDRPAEVLAYSSVGQAGYILLAVAVGGTAGLAAAVIYAVTNALNKTMLFLSAQPCRRHAGAAFAVGALSVAGVPPSAGFFGKVALFRAATALDSPALVALLVAGGALSLVYMFRVYQLHWWADRPEAAGSRVQGLLLLLLAASVVLLGIWPQPLVGLAVRSAGVVLAP